MFAIATARLGTLFRACILLYSTVAFGQQAPDVFTVDTPLVHDPVMAVEDGIYYLYGTGNGISHDLFVLHIRKEHVGYRVAL